VTVAVALTLLPVILATVGPRLDWPRYRKGGEESRFWHVWAAGVVRFRWIAAAAGAAILLALVAETTTIALGQDKADSLAKSGDAYVGLKALENNGFKVGVISPFEVLVQRTGGRVPQRRCQLSGRSRCCLTHPRRSQR
jgi:RND superfamily putative drug exporter